jgi:LAO/AO transport system kinase
MDALYGRTGRAHRIGVTGPPGGGKSTTVDGLAAALRKRQESVAVIAVDPSSPFTGGALLGDRIRMRTAEEDTEVFVRSMATRGSLGGLARATVDAADLLDAFGFGRILVETVGVGQAEHDVVSATDTVVVVLYPGGGDSVQAMKAGLMEIADVFVANKADQPGADRLIDDIEQMLELRRGRGGWKPPVVRVVATERKGIGELVAAIESHKSARERSGELEARRGARRLEQVRRDVEEGLREVIFGGGEWRAFIEGEIAAKRPPTAIAAEVTDRIQNALRAAQGTGPKPAAARDPKRRSALARSKRP